MIPPALAEVGQLMFKRVFHHLKHQTDHHTEPPVSDYQCLKGKLWLFIVYQQLCDIMRQLHSNQIPYHAHLHFPLHSIYDYTTLLSMLLNFFSDPKKSSGAKCLRLTS